MVAFSPDVFARFLAKEDDDPVVMLNLIRFLPDGGRERHLEYLRLAEPILGRFGVRILFRGDGLEVLTTGDVQDGMRSCWFSILDGLLSRRWWKIRNIRRFSGWEVRHCRYRSAAC